MKTAFGVLLLLVLATHVMSQSLGKCQCEQGSYWCASDDTLKFTYNCSGTENTKSVWSKIKGEDATQAQCTAMKELCDPKNGAHGLPLHNKACDSNCYDQCWRKDVGDCSDDDDNQIFCVGQCMAFCSANKCGQPKQWSPCQERCNRAHMELQPVNFIDYANCMAKCSSVPVSPWTSVEKAVPAGCKVPKQSCVKWTNCSGVMHDGAACTVAKVKHARCADCSVVDGDTCQPYATQERLCQANGQWSGGEPACRHYCDKSWHPQPRPTEPFTMPTLASPPAAAAAARSPLELSPLSGWLADHFRKYFKYQIDIFGSWLFLITDRCVEKKGKHPPLHAAALFAEYLDWDSDGKPNNPQVLAALNESKAAMTMFATDGRRVDKFEDSSAAREIPNNMDLECDETPGNDDTGGFDNAYCEITQQLFNSGYAKVYPEIFEAKAGTATAKAMDATVGDCGYAFNHSFKYPHCSGKFHYSDRTCDYSCLVSEYNYWALTTLLGGQDPAAGKGAPKGRCVDISDEWEMCSASALREGDPTIVAIMSDPKYNLPTKLPQGNYTVNLVTTAEQSVAAALSEQLRATSSSSEEQLVYWAFPNLEHYWICNHTNGTASLPADAQQHEVARCKRSGMEAVNLLCEVAVNGSVSAHFVNSYGDHYGGEPVTSGCSCAGGSSQPSRAQAGGCCVGSDQYAEVCGNATGLGPAIIGHRALSGNHHKY